MFNIKGLEKRRNTYIYRRVINPKLRRYFEGKSEYLKWLSKEKNEAVRLALAEEIKADALLDKARTAYRDEQRRKRLAKLPIAS